MKHSINKLYFIKKEIKLIEDEINELNNLGSMIYSDTPKGNATGDPTQKYVLKKIKLEKKLVRKLNKYITIYEETSDYIEKIDDEEIKLIARLRYMENKSWNEIANEMGKDVTEDAPRKKIKRFLQKNEKML